MVRINLIDPKKLSDQHLVAEYNEILMLVGNLKKHGVNLGKIPNDYCLGTGHITFFKNKLRYLEKRHSLIRVEMRSRDFLTNKVLRLKNWRSLYIDWTPKKKDYDIIKRRLIQKINLKPNYYRYYGEKRGRDFFKDLINGN